MDNEKSCYRGMKFSWCLGWRPAGCSGQKLLIRARNAPAASVVWGLLSAPRPLNLLLPDRPADRIRGHLSSSAFTQLYLRKLLIGDVSQPLVSAWILSGKGLNIGPLSRKEHLPV